MRVSDLSRVGEGADRKIVSGGCGKRLVKKYGSEWMTLCQVEGTWDREKKLKKRS